MKEPRAEFVQPPFKIDSDALEHAQVVVVSAPAAVGKSMLAEYVALRTGGILWDLAQASVGNNFAVGTLATSHGAAALGDVLQAIWSGTFLVVADALDEARLRVTFDAFTAFLDDLSSQVLKGISGDHPAFILLARRESAEFSAEWLRDSLDVSVCLAEIQFFDRAGASEFIEKQLEAEGQDPQSPVLVEAREVLIGRSLQLLGLSPDATEWPLDPARRFLGYAPVLVAMARYLARGGNPKRLVEDLKSTAAPAEMWTLMATLLDDMLSREREKFLDGFRELHRADAAACNFNEWDKVFQAQEQCEWLVTEAMATDAPPSPVPPALEGAYRARVRTWMPEHPFVGASQQEFASAVFGDYVRARILHAGTASARAAIRSRAADASYRPTEMLARFFFRLPDRAPIAPEDLAVLYESLLAAEEAGQPVQLMVIAQRANARHVGQIGIGDHDSISFEVAGDAGPLRFFTRLGTASIVSDGSVHLGAHGRSLELGPNTVVVAPVVEVLAESILVKTSDEGRLGTFIRCTKLTAADHVLRFVRGEQYFGVQADYPLQYPFADKKITLTFDETKLPLSPNQQDLARALFQLASMFRTEGYAGLGAYTEGVNRIAARNGAFGAVLAAAKHSGLITQEGNIYKFHPEQVSLNYRAVQTHDLSLEAYEFVRTIPPPTDGPA